jgi:hypothetical protein
MQEEGFNIACRPVPAGTFLGNLPTGKVPLSYIFTVRNALDDQRSSVAAFAPGSGLKPLPSGASNGQWIQDGKGFAFTQRKDGKQILNLKTADGRVWTNVLKEADNDLQSFTVAEDGQNIFGITSDDRGASFISHYAVAQRKLSRTLQIQQGYTWCKATPPIEAVATNADGQPVDYYYLQPPNLNPNRKYPVLMDMTSSTRHDHGRDADFLANCGIYYVSPNKLGIIKWGVTPSEEDTLAVYDALKKNPNVDMQRIYITGESITSGTAAEMIDLHPELWRGFVPVEAAAYPQLAQSKSGSFSALICIGALDQYNGPAGTCGYAEKFLLHACAKRITARIHYEPYTPHAFQPKQYKDAYETIAKFILKGY